MTDPIKNLSKEINTESVSVPGWCLKHIKAPDVVWNKPFKSRIAEFCNESLANGVHQYTEESNLKAVLRRLVVNPIDIIDSDLEDANIDENIDI